MPRGKKIRVILDTNLFISFLIGKRLKGLKESIVNSNITLIFSEQNILELENVASREKFRRYFPKDDVADLVKFIRITGLVYEINDYDEICRDPKDDFLLALAKLSNANYLVSGDSDLLELKIYHRTKIVTIDEFEKVLT
jgi:putative PIN family toxin of toxin-antitoxin system